MASGSGIRRADEGYESDSQYRNRSFGPISNVDVELFSGRADRRPCQDPRTDDQAIAATYRMVATAMMEKLGGSDGAR